MINCPKATVSLIPKLSLCSLSLSFVFELTSFCFVFNYSVFNVLSDFYPSGFTSQFISILFQLFKFLLVFVWCTFAITFFLAQKVKPTGPSIVHQAVSSPDIYYHITSKIFVNNYFFEDLQFVTLYFF